MRILYCVSIVLHTPEELGSLAKPLLEVEKRINGLQAEKAYREKARLCWEKVNERLEKERLNTPEKCKKMHIFVDGLPRVGDEHVQRVVEELIEQKLPQYQIIQGLLEKGATIHGTESLELLLEERNMWINVTKGISPDPKRKTDLLNERDKFIAKVINETLPENEIGFLFMGAAHKVDGELEKFPDIKIIYL